MARFEKLASVGKVCWQSADTLSLLSSFASRYVSWPMGPLRVGTTKLDEGDRVGEDLAAIADMAAGAFAELLMREKKGSGVCFCEIPASGLLSAVSVKSDILVSWLSDKSQPLKRLLLVFDRRADGKFRITSIRSERDLTVCDT